MGRRRRRRRSKRSSRNSRQKHQCRNFEKLHFFKMKGMCEGERDELGASRQLAHVP